MIDDYEKIYPPLTEQEFNDGAAGTYRGIPVCDDEDGRWVYAHGHRSRHQFAEAVNDFDREMAGKHYNDTEPYQAKDVQHRWAVVVIPAESQDGWLIDWGDDAKDHPLRFPVTVVSR